MLGHPCPSVSCSFLAVWADNTHQVAVVIVDNVSGLTVLKTVAVVNSESKRRLANELLKLASI